LRRGSGFTDVLDPHRGAPQFRLMTKEPRHKRPLHAGLAFDQVALTKKSFAKRKGE